MVKPTMKKIMATVMVLGLVALSMSTMVSAEDLSVDLLIDDKQPSLLAYDDAVPTRDTIRNTEGYASEKPRSDTLVQQQKKRPHVLIKGIWGVEDEEEPSGYAGGILYRRGRYGVFRGLWNKTDNASKGKIFGILRHGYFNGRVFNADGDVCHIVGLYKIDREEKTLKMKWMTPGNNGWAGFKVFNKTEIDEE